MAGAGGGEERGTEEREAPQGPPGAGRRLPEAEQVAEDGLAGAREAQEDGGEGPEGQQAAARCPGSWQRGAASGASGASARRGRAGIGPQTMRRGTKSAKPKRSDTVMFMATMTSDFLRTWMSHRKAPEPVSLGGRYLGLRNAGFYINEGLTILMKATSMAQVARNAVGQRWT